MRCVRGLGVVLAVLVALLAVSAAKADWTSTGSLTYTWHGDPARGCAVRGLCGFNGTAIVHSDGAGSSSPGSFFLFGLGPIVRVEDGQSGCADAASGADELNMARHGSRLWATLEPGVSAGRCAGPLASELAGLKLPVKKLGRRAGYDMRGRVSFAAGPFSGVLRSTLVLRRIPGQGEQSGSSSGSVTAILPSTRSRVEDVELSYRATATGTIGYGFSGATSPACDPLGSCGLTGELALALPTHPFAMKVEAYRVTHRLVSRRRALVDFGRGRIGFLLGDEQVQAQLSERLTPSQGTGCSDRVRVRLAFQLGDYAPPGHRTGLRVPIVVGSEASSGTILRTHCPGPDDTDLNGQSTVGPSGNLVAGVVTRAQLLHRHADVVLSRSGGFAGPGYSGSRLGQIVLHLTLIKVRAGTELKR